MSGKPSAGDIVFGLFLCTFGLGFTFVGGGCGIILLMAGRRSADIQGWGWPAAILLFTLPAIILGLILMRNGIATLRGRAPPERRNENE